MQDVASASTVETRIKKWRKKSAPPPLKALGNFSSWNPRTYGRVQLLHEASGRKGQRLSRLPHRKKREGEGAKHSLRSANYPFSSSGEARLAPIVLMHLFTVVADSPITPPSLSLFRLDLLLSVHRGREIPGHLPPQHGHQVKKKKRNHQTTLGKESPSVILPEPAVAVFSPAPPPSVPPHTSKTSSFQRSTWWYTNYYYIAMLGCFLKRE